METKSRSHSPMTVSISFASVFGIGGGMILISISRYFPDGHTIKPLLILLAAPITVYLRHVYEMCSPMVSELIRNFRMNRSFHCVLRRIDECLKDPGLSGGARASLRKHREAVQLFVVSNRRERLEALMMAQDLDVNK